MNADEAMEVVAAEARRQGFSCYQLEPGAWRFVKDGSNYFFTVNEVLDIYVRVRPTLISVGMVWFE